MLKHLRLSSIHALPTVLESRRVVYPEQLVVSASGKQSTNSTSADESPILSLSSSSCFWNETRWPPRLSREICDARPSPELELSVPFRVAAEEDLKDLTCPLDWLSAPCIIDSFPGSFVFSMTSSSRPSALALRKAIRRGLIVCCGSLPLPENNINPNFEKHSPKIYNACSNLIILNTKIK